LILILLKNSDSLSHGRFPWWRRGVPHQSKIVSIQQLPLHQLPRL
jgi:hypothetical protein